MKSQGRTLPATCMSSIVICIDGALQEIEDFVEGDVYVKAGLVTSHKISPYHVVVQ